MKRRGGGWAGREKTPNHRSGCKKNDHHFLSGGKGAVGAAKRNRVETNPAKDMIFWEGEGGGAHWGGFHDRTEKGKSSTTEKNQPITKRGNSGSGGNKKLESNFPWEGKGVLLESGLGRKKKERGNPSSKLATGVGGARKQKKGGWDPTKGRPRFPATEEALGRSDAY